jgi:hypothetical protein
MHQYGLVATLRSGHRLYIFHFIAVCLEAEVMLPCATLCYPQLWMSMVSHSL